MDVTNWRNVVCSEEGQDLIEYALLVALIAIVCIGAVTSVGSAIGNVLNSVATTLTAAI